MPAKAVQKKTTRKQAKPKRTLPPAVKEWIRDVKAYREEQARKGKEITYKEAMSRLSAERKGKDGTGRVKNMDMTTMKGRYRALGRKRERALIDKTIINLRKVDNDKMFRFQARTIIKGFDYYTGPEIPKTAEENILLQSVKDNVVYEYDTDLEVNPPFKLLIDNGFGSPLLNWVKAGPPLT